MNNIESDMAAAKLLGYIAVEVEQAGVNYVLINGVDAFSLSNPADLLATVIALGEKHNIGLLPLENFEGTATSWQIVEGNSGDVLFVFHTEYEQAVRAAVMEVSHE